jgi:hypothetical protein
MRRPDAVSDRGPGDRDPDQARAALRRDRATEDMDGNNARNETYHASEQHEPPVVILCQAGKDAEHTIDPRLAPRLLLFD